jgi:hypothetical protein
MTCNICGFHVPAADPISAALMATHLQVEHSREWLEHLRTAWQAATPPVVNDDSTTPRRS